MAEKAKKVKKKENAVQRYIRETTGELRKVSWPTWAEAQRLTLLVLLVMVFVGIFLAGVVSLAHNLLTMILTL